MNQVKVIKIGGKVAEEDEDLDDFLSEFVKMKGHKVLVHGGGVIANKLAEKLGIKPKMIDGRRVTDRGTLDIVTMVYAGLVNKKIVAKLQALGQNAVGLTGADLNIIQAVKRNPVPIDFGWVGDINSVKVNWLKAFLEQGIVPVIVPLTHDGKGNMLNTNADSIASYVAQKLADKLETELIMCFDQPGVMEDGKVIKELDFEYYQELKKEKIITDGMIPKLQLGFKALEESVSRVTMKNFSSLNDETKGTSLLL